MSVINHCYVLEKIINDRKIRRMAEIGVWKGHLARHLLRKCRHIIEYYAIDSWKVLEGDDYGRMGSDRINQEQWDKIYFKVCQEMSYHRAMKIIKMTALDAAKLFPLKKFTGFFDFVYIDTSHFYQNTLDEIRAWLPLVRKGGIIGGHDYAATRQEHQGVRKAVDEIFGKDVILQGDDMVWYVEIK